MQGWRLTLLMHRTKGVFVGACPPLIPPPGNVDKWSFAANVVSFWGLCPQRLRPPPGSCPLALRWDFRPWDPLIAHPWNKSCGHPWVYSVDFGDEHTNCLQWRSVLWSRALLVQNNNKTQKQYRHYFEPVTFCRTCILSCS